MKYKKIRLSLVSASFLATLLMNTWVVLPIHADADKKPDKSTSDDIQKRRSAPDVNAVPQPDIQEDAEDDDDKKEEKQEREVRRHQEERPVGGMGMGGDTTPTQPEPAPTAPTPQPKPVAVAPPTPVVESPPGYMNRIWFTPASESTAADKDTLLRAATSNREASYPATARNASEIILPIVGIGGTAAYLWLRRFRSKLDRLD